VSQVVSSFELLFKDRLPEPPDDVDEVARAVESVPDTLPLDARTPLLMSLLAGAGAGVETDEEVETMNALVTEAGAALELKRCT
jgi:hypothetical protein